MPGPAIFDLENFSHLLGPERDAVLRRLSQSLSDYSAVYLKNTGLTSQIQSEAVKQMTEMFSLPTEIKHQYNARLNGGRTGFIPFGVESSDAQFTPDPKESWHISREPENASLFKSFYLNNHWPSELPSFTHFFKKYYALLDGVTETLVDASLESFIGPNRPAMMTDHNSVLRMTKYSMAATAPKVDFLVQPHRDAVLFTIHLYASHTGYEYHDGTTWVEYSRPDTGEDLILATVGDMLGVLSNDLFIPRLHRVRACMGEATDRFFIGHFVAPSPDVFLRCHRGQEEAAKYLDIANLDIIIQRAKNTRMLI